MSSNHTTITDQVNTRVYVYNIPETVLFDERLKFSDIKVYARVRSLADSCINVFPSNQWLANETGLKERAVRESLERLEKFTYISRITIEGKRSLIIGKPMPMPEKPKAVDNLSPGRHHSAGGGGTTVPHSRS